MSDEGLRSWDERGKMRRWCEVNREEGRVSYTPGAVQVVPVMALGLTEVLAGSRPKRPVPGKAEALAARRTVVRVDRSILKRTLAVLEVKRLEAVR
jgi:hypothetical protein